jgi:hypothetical protein
LALSFFSVLNEDFSRGGATAQRLPVFLCAVAPPREKSSSGRETFTFSA